MVPWFLPWEHSQAPLGAGAGASEGWVYSGCVCSPGVHDSSGVKMRWVLLAPFLWPPCLPFLHVGWLSLTWPDSRVLAGSESELGRAVAGCHCRGLTLLWGVGCLETLGLGLLAPFRPSFVPHHSAVPCAPVLVLPVAAFLMRGAPAERLSSGLYVRGCSLEVCHLSLK